MYKVTWMYQVTWKWLNGGNLDVRGNPDVAFTGIFTEIFTGIFALLRPGLERRDFPAGRGAQRG